jgi:hypothetical protein
LGAAFQELGVQFRGICLIDATTKRDNGVLHAHDCPMALPGVSPDVVQEQRVIVPGGRQLAVDRGGSISLT